MAGDLEESSRLEGGSGVEEDGMEEEKEESSQVVVCRTSALFASWVYVDLSSPQLRELICPGSNAGKATIPATSKPNEQYSMPPTGKPGDWKVFGWIS